MVWLYYISVDEKYMQYINYGMILDPMNAGSHSLLTLVLQVVLSSTVGLTSFQTMTSSLVYKTSPLVQPSPYNVLHTNKPIGGDPMDRHYQQYKTTHSIRSSMGTHQYLILTLTISTTSLMEGSPVTLHNTQLLSTCTLDQKVRGDIIHLHVDIVNGMHLS